MLHVLAPGEAGGLESVVRLLATGQQRRGHRVRVATILDGADAARPFRAGLEDRGVAVTPLVLPGRAYLRERSLFGKLCRELQPDIVHTHGYRPDIIDAGVARGLRVPTVTTVHGFTGGGFRNRCYEWAQQRSFRDFDAVVAVSAPLEARLAASGIHRRRLHVVPNAYDADPVESRAAARRSLGIPADAYIAGWVGRLTREKGADVFVEAVANSGAPAGLHAAIIGDGSERASLEAAARAQGCASRISWHGVIRNAARLYPAFDVFVLSSRTEGTPIALFEAMAAGVPIVATRVGGVPDVVTEAEALLVPSDDPAALAAAIRAVHDDPSGAARRARAAAAVLRERFGTASWLAHYDRIYNGLVTASSVRHSA